MLEFIAAVYNEQAEIRDLINHVSPYVDTINICDDGSTDDTVKIIKNYQNYRPVIIPVGPRGYERVRPVAPPAIRLKVIEHTGLPETVKHEALQLVSPGAWVLMLDADERLEAATIQQVRDFVNSDESLKRDYVYFNQIEIIDNRAVRYFQKCKLFRKEAVRFPLNNIHADDQFEGQGDHRPEWTVYHRKSSYKQRVREEEYLETYRKLREEGHIDEGREKWLQGLHHFVRPKN